MRARPRDRSSLKFKAKARSLRARSQKARSQRGIRATTKSRATGKSLARAMRPLQALRLSGSQALRLSGSQALRLSAFSLELTLNLSLSWT